VENKPRRDEGIGFGGGIELGFSQSQALQDAFEDVDAQRRDAVANLAEHLSGELRQQAKLGLREVDRGDQSLLRSAACGRQLLRELEDGPAIFIGLAAQTEERAVLVTVRDVAGAHDVLRWKRVDQEPPFPLDPREFVRPHPIILATSAVPMPAGL